ncbi:ROK family protein [Haladaptatus pallidirubidus]|uniref:ROK family protein n=1 Tax=Haladaptatus pallidirubidus TaxID=1008152 RepID=A0AAV3UHV8_9EURY|nr:ROK family protein [Haladaptatus pallidirubidus]
MYYVGVDLGATNIRTVVSDETATILGRAQDETPHGPTGKTVTETVLRVVREACDHVGVRPTDIDGAGIASMGTMDPTARVITVPANVSTEIGSIPLVDPLSETLDTDNVHLRNDTVAGVIGERFYTYPRAENLVYITISSGIGVGIIADGDVISGRDGNAGEMGHMTIDVHGFMECGCGQDGHWEAYCSGNNIPQFVRALHQENPVETALPIDSLEFSAKHLFERSGTDAFADHVIDRLAHFNTVGVANIVHAYDPAAISIGGAVALNNPEHVVEPIKSRLDEAVLVEPPEINLSEQGSQVVLKGALTLAITNGTEIQPPA